MACVDPSERINAEEALSHIWIKGEPEVQKTRSLHLEEYQQYSNEIRLKQLLYVVNFLKLVKEKGNRR